MWGKSFKEALLSSSKSINELKKGKVIATRKFTRTTVAKGPVTIYFMGMDESIQVMDLWRLFKSKSVVKDIILPKKRNKFGKRIGFIVAANTS